MNKSQRINDMLIFSIRKDIQSKRYYESISYFKKHCPSVIASLETLAFQLF